MKKCQKITILCQNVLRLPYATTKKKPALPPAKTRKQSCRTLLERLGAQLGRGFPEMPLAESGKILHRRETVLVGNLVDGLRRGLYVADYELALAVEQPFVDGLLELLLELALECGRGHIGQLGELLYVGKVLIVFQHQSAESVVEPQYRDKHPRQIVLGIISPQQQEQFLKHQLMEMRAQDAVVHTVAKQAQKLVQPVTDGQSDEFLAGIHNLTHFFGKILDGIYVAEFRSVDKRTAHKLSMAVLPAEEIRARRHKKECPSGYHLRTLPPQSYHYVALGNETKHRPLHLHKHGRRILIKLKILEHRQLRHIIIIARLMFFRIEYGHNRLT